MTKKLQKQDFTGIPDSATIKGLTFTVETIDKRTAQLYIDAMMPGQRNKKPTKIQQFADLIAAGKWFKGISVIGVDEYGRTVDGQNRLEACLASGMPMETVVIRGVETEAIPSIDTGNSRTFADVCRMMGIDDPVVVSSITKRAWMWENGIFYTKGARGPSFDELVRFLELNHELIHPAAARGRDMKREVPQIPPSVAGFAWYQFKLLQPDQADHFHESLLTRANVPKGSPILTLHNQLTRPLQSGERKKTPDEILAYIFHAWNSYRRDEVDRGRFQLTKIGKLNNDNFPIPK